MRPRTEVGRNSFPTTLLHPHFLCTGVRTEKSLCGPGTRLFIIIIYDPHLSWKLVARGTAGAMFACPVPFHSGECLLFRVA